MVRRLVLAGMLLVLLANPVAGAIGTTAPADDGAGAGSSGEAVATADGDIVRTMTFALTPREPGSVEVTLAYRIPDAVEELRTSVPADATVRETEAFEPDGSGNYTWTGDGHGGSITFDLPANRTGEYQYDRPLDGAATTSRAHSTAGRDPSAASTAGTGLLFVDTGSWALVSVPPISVSWSYRGQPAPSLVREVRTEGEGVAGTQMVYLGPHTRTTRTVDGQTVTLVVPAAAALEPDPDAVLSAIGAASASLQVGAKPDRMLLIAAPADVDWGPFGLALGPDAWVRADQPLDDPNNVWLHEYVHVRQDFTTTPDARWTREAMGEYYAAALTLEQGRIGFEAFQEHLARGEDSEYDETVLSRPETWTALSNYVKGALVFGDLDRRMRLATDGSEPAAHLVRAMNRRGKPVDAAFLAESVRTLAGDEAATAFDRYTTTEATPDMWTRSAHQTAFSTLPPRIVTVAGPSYRVEGPYRNRSVADIPVLVPGERLSVTLRLENEGGAAGEYRRELRVDGTQVAVATGRLAGGANTAVLLTHTVANTGNYDLRIDGETRSLRVAQPLEPQVTGIEAPDGEIMAGTSVPVTVTVANPGARPADGTVGVLVDGHQRTSWRVRLDSGSTASKTFDLTVDGQGERVIRVGNETVTVMVATSTTETTTATDATSDGQSPATVKGDDTTATGSPVQTPGVGIAGVVGVLVLLAGRTLLLDR